VLEDRARAAVGRRVLTATGADPDEQAGRAAYYRFLRQNGLWTREVTGMDPEKERARLDPFCPVRSLPADYPPTMLIHGTEDTDVPYSLSADMDQALTRRGIPHELVTVPGAGHGLSGLTPEKAAKTYARATAFIRRHMDGDSTGR
jgi:dipeptidyl aminopeptidase/acylaminoacyl peptidase